MSHAPDRAMAAPGAGDAPAPESGPQSEASRGGGGRLPRIGSDALRLALAAALFVRAALSLADAAGAARGGVQLLPFGPSVAFGASTPFWPTLWALLSLAGGIGLVYRSAAGWVLAGAACLGYLAVGIGNLGLLDTAVGIGDPGFWTAFVLDVVVPAVVLVGLYQLRGNYVHVAARPGLGGRRLRRPRP